MIRKMTTLFSIPLVFIYMSLVVKKKAYAYGGILIIIAMFLSFTYAKSIFFIRLIEKYIPWISGGMLLWAIYLIFVTIFITFIVYAYREEKSGKFSTTTRDDLIRILKPNIANIIFWTFIIALNLIAFILERSHH